MKALVWGLFALTIVELGLAQPDFIRVCHDARASGDGYVASESDTGSVPPGCWAETEEGFVYCIGVNLTSIPQNLPQTTTCLVIQNGQINHMDASDINYLPRLKVLGIFDDQKLEMLTGVFDHPRLETLALSGCGLDSVPTVTNGKLKRLDLRSNKLENLDLSSVAGNPVENFDLSSNPFTDFPEDQLAPFQTTLTNLSILPSNIEMLTSTSFSHTPQLATLSIAANTFKQDAFLEVASRLVNLDFSVCTIESFGLRGLKETTLNLGYKQSCKDPSQGLTIQPNSFNGMPNLQSLNLDNTKLRHVPKDAFRGLPSLSGPLLIEFNQLQTISDGAFAGLVSVSRLRLTNNYNAQGQVKYPDAMFSSAGLQNLTLLDLSSFGLRTLPDNMFQNLPKLIYLYLGFNQMQRMDVSVLEPVLPHLQRLSLYGNPWICDCKLRWMREILDERPAIFDSGTTYLWKCAAPDSLKGRIFSKIPADQFKC